ncbi:MAG: response regulator [Bryobacter sp.]|nr:response regulator [Bryobacter sp.]
MSAPPYGGPARRILVVDDAAACVETLQAALSAIPGLAITFVPDAESAVSAMNQAPFAALITDINLPLMDGVELVSRIRADERSGSIPVIVVSGDPDPEATRRALLAGANAFFAKPFSPSAVRRMLEELLDAN